ncbi:MAG: agmatinase [Nanoarchaeota archaeon]|nr:agmatinase [Nanoarchaeota archaeon]
MMEKRKEFLYESSNSFLGEVIGYDDSKYVIIPSPLEVTTSFLKGTRFAPSEIIKASLSLENYDFEARAEVKNKIYTLNELDLTSDLNRDINRIKDTVSEVLKDGKIPILIGGEHTITYASSMAFDDVTFVLFDAHADFKESFNGVEITHASVSRLISKSKKIVLIGVRSLSSDEIRELKSKDVKVIYQSENLDREIKKLSRSLNGKKVYISIDADVLDPCVIQSIGTPQPGGLSYFQLFNSLKAIVKHSRLVGFDVSEVIPSQTKIAEVTAAKLIADVIALNESH